MRSSDFYLGQTGEHPCQFAHAPAFCSVEFAKLYRPLVDEFQMSRTNLARPVVGNGADHTFGTTDTGFLHKLHKNRLVQSVLKRHEKTIGTKLSQDRAGCVFGIHRLGGDHYRLERTSHLIGRDRAHAEPHVASYAVDEQAFAVDCVHVLGPPIYKNHIVALARHVSADEAPD